MPPEAESKESMVFQNPQEQAAWVAFVAASIACDGALSAIDHGEQADRLVEKMRARLPAEKGGTAKRKS
jgi:hypothetical protein